MFGFAKSTPTPKLTRTTSLVKTGGDSETSTTVAQVQEKRELLRTARGNIIRDNKPNSVAEVKRIVRNVAPELSHLRFIRFKIIDNKSRISCPYSVEFTVRLLDGEEQHWCVNVKDLEETINQLKVINYKKWQDATEEAMEEEATIEEADSEEEDVAVV